MNPSLESKAATMAARFSAFVGRRLGKDDEEDQIRLALGIATKQEDGTIYNKTNRLEGLNKTAVLEGFRAFNDLALTLKYPRLCCTAILMVLRLQSDTNTRLSYEEAGQVLNAAPQIFESPEPSLRRLLYLLLLELGPVCTRKTELVWKPLIRDIHETAAAAAQKNDGASISIGSSSSSALGIRLLSTLLVHSSEDDPLSADIDDASDAATVMKKLDERTVQRSRKSLQDSTLKKLDGAAKRILKSRKSSPECISAVLVSATHLEPAYPSTVQAWRQAALCALYFNSSSNMVQFHALYLLSHLKHNLSSPMKENKATPVEPSHKEKSILDKLTRKHNLNDAASPLSWILLIRSTTRQLLCQEDDGGHGGFFLTACLTHSSEMVVYEAARALLCHLFADPPQILVERALDAARGLAASSKPAARKCGQELVAVGTKMLGDSEEGKFFF